MFSVSKLKTNLNDKTTAFISTAQETLYKIILVILTVTTLLWLAIFLYASFYYSYIPPASHTRPVHLQFTRDCSRETSAMCDFPSARVLLTRRENFLMVGQPYKIVLDLEMPESPANQNLGMFMVCSKLITKNQLPVEKSCRSALLQYKSSIFSFISTIALYPLLASGSHQEKQTISVELFSNFQEDITNPVTEAFIELQSYKIEVYRSTFKIHAHFTGLRYLMYHWPLTSAVMGVCTNVFFLSVIAFLSWWKFFNTKDIIHVGYDLDSYKSKQLLLEEEEEENLSPKKVKKKVLKSDKEEEKLNAKKLLKSDKEELEEEILNQKDVQNKLKSDKEALEEEEQEALGKLIEEESDDEKNWTKFDKEEDQIVPKTDTHSEEDDNTDMPNSKVNLD